MSTDSDQKKTIAAPLPISPTSRFEIVDIVRGFALFGVLVANMVWTSQSFALTGVQRAALASADIDRYVLLLVELLVDYKFYTIFAMLFGLGFAMQLSRVADRRRNVNPVFMRRLTILFIIGIGHGLLLWFGDILHIYALVGFILILFRNRSDRVVAGWAFVIALLVALLPFIQWVTMAGALTNSVMGDKIEAVRFVVLTSGSWSEVLGVNWTFNHDQYSHFDIGFDSTVYLYLSVLWKFLVGFVIGRRMLLQRAEEYLSTYRRLLPWAVAIGVAGNAFLAIAIWIYDVWIPDSTFPLILLSWTLVELSMLALSFAYVAGLVLLYQRSGWRHRIGLLAPVGQMALTNYLLQSIILVMLFYGSGLNLLGKIGAAVCLVLSIVIFGIQIVVSRWWLKRFRFGPMEWLWRCLTYGKRQPFRLGNTISA